jgi:hypothetical protein
MFFFGRGGHGWFLVAWVFPFFQFYLFMVEDLVENQVFYSNFYKRERKFFFEEG